MYLLSIIAPVVGVFIYWFIRDYSERPSKHDHCLANIKRLERELGIGQPADAALTAFEIKPGARWAVTDPNVRFFRDDLDPKSELARSMMASGMLYSGEYEAARQRMEESQ